jgi:hypothetical protein
MLIKTSLVILLYTKTIIINLKKSKTIMLQINLIYFIFYIKKVIIINIILYYIINKYDNNYK